MRATIRYRYIDMWNIHLLKDCSRISKILPGKDVTIVDATNDSTSTDKFS